MKTKDEVDTNKLTRFKHQKAINDAI